MLKKEQRIRRNSEFRRVYKTGKAVSSKYVVVFYRKNGAGRTRFGFSVSKKIGNAVVRNRVKRLMREVCRKHNSYIKDGYDIIFIGRKRSVNRSFKEIESDIMKVLSRQGLKIRENGDSFDK